MTRAAWFHCFAGVAGDMALGALIDAGADLEEVVHLVERLPVPGWKVTAREAMRNGIGATQVVVEAQETPIVRTHAHIAALVEEARLPVRVRDRALTTFTALAAAEGRVHRRNPLHVHFHEVGAVDAIVDVVGTCAALEVLGIDEVHSSAVAVGSGLLRTVHGVLPNPGPAVVELLRGAPTYGRHVGVELTTPTGAALLAALARRWGPMPAMVIDSSGFGAGTRELADLPNLTQVVVGDLVADGAEVGDRGQPVVLLEANVDDVTGEAVAAAIGALLDAGAHDAWVTPIVMKKGRPAYTVSALADPAVAAQVGQALTTATGSLGVRGERLQRWPAARRNEQIEVAGLPVRVKIGPGRVKVEHDDAARVAQLTGLPLREVHFRAEAAWRDRRAPGQDLPAEDGGSPPPGHREGPGGHPA